MRQRSQSHLWIAAEVNNHALISAAQQTYAVCQEEIIEISKYSSLMDDKNVLIRPRIVEAK